MQEEEEEEDMKAIMLGYWVILVGVVLEVRSATVGLGSV